ncbi:hypothetical protein M378DRAFT_167155 [Amanita muscaria Koide BX008]|uniref:Uncharacterized protein n=1 Tax=Amanita muscaria (strain Koide BX008) TaxID=946122 RepID=A0A0C2WIH6_AMAMK|nr:hypothetical protein M378DRAFT_167155 [Amanita muscaria Koide BX008]
MCVAADVVGTTISQCYQYQLSRILLLQAPTRLTALVCNCMDQVRHSPTRSGPSHVIDKALKKGESVLNHCQQLLKQAITIPTCPSRHLPAQDQWMRTTSHSATEYLRVF